jgi:hypothetical protein
VVAIRDPLTGKSIKVVEKPAGPERSIGPVSVEHFSAGERDALAYEVSKLIGYADSVPITVFRKDYGKGGKGTSLQVFLEGHKTQNSWAGREMTAVESLRLGVFDYLIGNIDRHGGNYMRDKDGKPKAIDNGLSFGRPNEGDPSGGHLGVNSQGVSSFLKRWRTINFEKSEGRQVPEIDELQRTYEQLKLDLWRNKDSLKTLVGNTRLNDAEKKAFNLRLGDLLLATGVRNALKGTQAISDVFGRAPRGMRRDALQHGRLVTKSGFTRAAGGTRGRKTRRSAKLRRELGL